MKASRSPPSRRRRPAADAAGALPVILVEDNRLLRDGLASMLGAHGLTIAATGSSAGQAMKLVARHRPQLLLLDAVLGDGETVRLVEKVRRISPGIKVIIMHLVPEHHDVTELVRAGVSGFIMKDASSSEFVAAIRSVADGRTVLPPTLAATLFSHVAAHAVTRGSRAVRAARRMTPRERDVTSLIARGFGNREIGARLGIAPHTVKSHVHNILEKLALRTRLEVAAYAHSRAAGRGAAGG